jgi:outer membrane protein insertion porin family
VNDFNLSYSDPALRQTRFSGTVSAYRSQARYTVADLGRSLRTGGSFEVGFPVPTSPFSRLRLIVWCGSRDFGRAGLLGEQSSIYGNSSFRSTSARPGARHASRHAVRDAGGMQSISAQLSGGPLGGTYRFQQYRPRARAYAPLGQIGGKAAGRSR